MKAVNSGQQITKHYVATTCFHVVAKIMQPQHVPSACFDLNTINAH